MSTFARLLHAAQVEAKADTHRVIPIAKEHSIIHDLSEYLFDLFDAPMEVGYADIEALTEESWPLFVSDTYDSDDDSVQEFTLLQKAQHDKFCALFERLCEDFLTEQGLTLDEFYRAIDRALQTNTEIIAKDEATEILQVLQQVTNFTDWAAEMRSIAQSKQKFIE